MDEQMISKIVSALQNADLHDGDEGNHYWLFDLLGFSGENKSVMITQQRARAAHSVMSARVAELEEVLKTAEAEARRFAGFYPDASDGRNTFVIFADKIAALAPHPKGTAQ